MEYPEYLAPILDRFDPTFPQAIDCGKGWWPILADIDTQLAKIDPDYRIYQIKEKFGGLRYYFAPSFPDRAPQMNALVTEFEHKCAQTCEATGKEGVLMIRNGYFKTLNESFAGYNGWEIVESF